MTLVAWREVPLSAAPAAERSPRASMVFQVHLGVGAPIFHRAISHKWGTFGSGWELVRIREVRGSRLLRLEQVLQPELVVPRVADATDGISARSSLAETGRSTRRRVALGPSNSNGRCSSTRRVMATGVNRDVGWVQLQSAADGRSSRWHRLYMVHQNRRQKGA
jgi:hypothetical protein